MKYGLAFSEDVTRLATAMVRALGDQRTFLLPKHDEFSLNSAARMLGELWHRCKVSLSLLFLSNYMRITLTPTS